MPNFVTSRIIEKVNIILCKNSVIPTILHEFVSGYIGKFVAKLTLQAAYKTDKRLRIMNEIIGGVQVIKMYAWEKPFSRLVDKARE